MTHDFFLNKIKQAVKDINVPFAVFQLNTHTSSSLRCFKNARTLSQADFARDFVRDIADTVGSGGLKFPILRLIF